MSTEPRLLPTLHRWRVLRGRVVGRPDKHGRSDPSERNDCSAYLADNLRDKGGWPAGALGGDGWRQVERLLRRNNGVVVSALAIVTVRTSLNARYDVDARLSGTASAAIFAPLPPVDGKH